MFNFLFGFDSYLDQEVSFMFNLNHVYLLLFIAAFIVTLTLVFKNKSLKTKKIVLATVGITMILLEIGRIVWKVLDHLHTHPTLEGFNWAWSISFQLCAIMSWFVAINILIYAFAKTPRWNKISLNIMVGIALISGTLTFLYPDLIDADRSILHFRNAQTVLQHILLIFVPVFLVASKQIKVEFKNIWIPMVGLFGAAAIAMTASLTTDNNFMFMIRCSLLEDLGINLPFPWHLVPLAIIFFTLQVAVYGGISGVRALKEKRKS